MKSILKLFFVLGIALTSCKKDSAVASKTTLSVSVFVKDANGQYKPAMSYFYLFPICSNTDLSTATQLKSVNDSKAVLSFTARDVSSKSAGVQPGTYILAVELTLAEDAAHAGRYSYKQITINQGDQINDSMTFAADGKSFIYEPWNSNK